MKTLISGKTVMAGLAFALMLSTTSGAHAGVCTYGTTAGNGPQATYAFTLPATIALTGNETPGTVLWSSTPITLSGKCWICRTD